MANSLAPTTSLTWAQRWVTVILIALTAGGCVFWVLQVTGMPNVVSDLKFATNGLAESGQDGGGLARALGASPRSNLDSAPQAAAKSSLVLVAVVNADRGGVALIALEGQKAQPYRVGDSVQAGQYLVGLGLRSAQLGPAPKGPATETLIIPVPEIPNK
jgi:hypothetical protein